MSPETSGDKAPAVHKDEEDQLERQGYDHRRQHHHAHAHQHAGDHKIYHQEGNKEQKPDLERAFQFRDHEGRRHDAQGNLLGRSGSLDF